MKKITYVKFSIDIVMAVVFVLLFNTKVLGGLAFHEIAGLIIAVMFLTHVLLNVNWVKTVTVKLFDRKLPGKTRFGYLLNLLLLITMTFIMVSGIFISRVVFPNINIGNEGWFKMTHISVSFFVLALVAVHVGLHWQWVIQVWKKIFNLKSKTTVLSVIAKAAAVCMLVFGAYEMYSTNFVSRISGISMLFGASSQMSMQEGHGMMMKGNGEQARPAFGGDMDGENGQQSFDRSNFPQNGERPAFAKGGMEGHGESASASVFNVLATYLGIMSVFIVIVYYLEKFILRNKRKKRSVANA